MDDEIKELQRQRAYLSAQLEEATKELARLDLLNLTLTQQKRQAIAAFNFIKIMQEKIEKALTIDDLCNSVVKAVTSDMFMDSSALLRINYKTRDASILASVGLPENTKGFKLYESISKQEVLKPTFVNSKSQLKPFHMFVRNSFKIPYFVWYPVADEEDGILVLFAGNRFEDLVSKQPLSEASLETFGAISSVILLRRDNIVNVQEILKAKEKRIDFLARILKTSPISVIATDKDAKITYCNPAAEKLYGYDAEELVGEDLSILNAEPDAKIQKEIVDTVGQGKIWRGEILNRKKNGDLFYIRSSIYKLLDKEANFIALVGFQEDTTERKKAEEALQESEEKYRQLVSSTTDAIMVFDADTRQFIEVNKACEDLYGYSREEFLKLKHKDVTAEPEESEDSITKALQGKLQRIPIRYHKKKDGTVFPVEISVSSFKLGGRRVLCGVIRDITERKRSEEKILLYQEQLQSLVSELTLAEERERRRIATELHDNIGQTLAITKIKLGSLRELASSTSLTGPIDEVRELIEQAIEYSRSLTFELSSPILYGLGLEAAVEWLAEQIQKQHGIMIDFEKDGHFKPLDNNISVLLFLAVRELMLNIVKHAKARKAKVLIWRDGHNIKITVQDDGVGFDASEIESTLRKTGGFGLFSIRERMDHLGGHLEIESQPGHGTRVTLVAPLKVKKKTTKGK